MPRPCSNSDIAAAVGITEPPQRLDSMVKYTMLARGDTELYLRYLGDYRECIWDHAPGSVVATEAGAVVTDFHGKPLDFSVGRRLFGNAGIIASCGKDHAAIVAAAAGALAKL